MNEPKRLSMIWVLLAALVCVIIVFDVAYASGDEVIQSNDMNAQTAGDIGGNRSYGFGHALGDIDLNQCMGSTQWSTIIVAKQKLVLNKWCAADSLDSKGMYEAAAMLRCSIKEVGKVLGSTCIEALTVHADVVNSVPMADESDSDDEDNERLEPIYARLMDLEAQRQSDADNARKAAQRPIPQPQIVQQPLLSDEQRIKLQAVLDEP